MLKNKFFCLMLCMLVTATLLPDFTADAHQIELDNNINISIGAGMLRGSIAGISHARRIGFGTNIRVVNKGNESKDGSWELVYSDFSDVVIKNKKGNFTLSSDDLLPYIQGIIIYTSFLDKISKLSMTVKVDDYTVTRTGIRIGPLVILGKYIT